MLHVLCICTEKNEFINHPIRDRTYIRYVAVEFVYIFVILCFTHIILIKFIKNSHPQFIFLDN